MVRVNSTVVDLPIVATSRQRFFRLRRKREKCITCPVAVTTPRL